MSGRKFRQGAIEGVKVTTLLVHEDSRGWLCELFREDELDKSLWPAMSYVSSTKPGVVRGPHEHRDQTDLFCFVGPSRFRVVLWDNRPQSPTFGNRMEVELGEGKPGAVIVPAGVVHGYKNIGDRDGWVFNLPNRLYRGKARAEAVDEVRHEQDPDTDFRME